MLVYFVSRDAAWQKYRSDTMRRLAQATGMQIHILTSALPDPTWGSDDAHVRYHAFRSWLPRSSRASFLPGAIVETLRRRPDVILAVNNASHLTEYLLFYIRRLLGVRFVWWTHGYDHAPRERSRMERVRRAIMVGALQRADAVIAFSERGRNALVLDGVPAAKVFHAPNTLDTDRLLDLARTYPRAQRDRWCRELQIDPSRRYVLFTGRLNPSKKVLQAAAAFSAVRKRVPNAGWLVVGDGPERAALEAFVRTEHLEGVHFLGPVFDDISLAKIFAVSDVLLMPVNVGLGIVHGFCFGVPLVTSSCSTHGPEIQYLEHGKNGYLSEGTEAVQDMANHVSDLLSNEALWTRLSECAISTAAGPASIGRMIDAMREALACDRANATKGRHIAKQD